MAERTPGIWQRATALADATPESRNRYVDFLRAASIAAVILGHWLVSAPYMLDGSVVPGHMLALAPWTRWLTLVVQVMPIFFLVGGYANAVAWEAARRKGTRYDEWLGARIRRLIAPVLPVLLAWIGIALAAVTAGLPGDWVGHGDPARPGADLVPGGLRHGGRAGPRHPSPVAGASASPPSRASWRRRWWSTRCTWVSAPRRWATSTTPSCGSRCTSSGMPGGTAPCAARCSGRPPEARCSGHWWSSAPIRSPWWACPVRSSGTPRPPPWPCSPWASPRPAWCWRWRASPGACWPGAAPGRARCSSTA